MARTKLLSIFFSEYSSPFLRFQPKMRWSCTFETCSVTQLAVQNEITAARAVNPVNAVTYKSPAVSRWA